MRLSTDHKTDTSINHVLTFRSSNASPKHFALTDLNIQKTCAADQQKKLCVQIMPANVLTQSMRHTATKQQLRATRQTKCNFQNNKERICK